MPDVFELKFSALVRIGCVGDCNIPAVLNCFELNGSALTGDWICSYFDLCDLWVVYKLSRNTLICLLICSIGKVSLMSVVSFSRDIPDEVHGFEGLETICKFWVMGMIVGGKAQSPF